MTYDTNRTVRMEAVYWLFTGRTKETLSRLKELMETSISLRIRTYAITSYFSVWGDFAPQKTNALKLLDSHN